VLTPKDRVPLLCSVSKLQLSCSWQEVSLKIMLKAMGLFLFLSQEYAGVISGIKNLN